MIQTPGDSEKFKGASPSTAPTLMPPGVFSVCSGGIPEHGSFAKIAGKSVNEFSLGTGGIISISYFGTLIVVQTYSTLAIFELTSLLPDATNYVVDNSGNLVYDKSGLPILI